MTDGRVTEPAGRRPRRREDLPTSHVCSSSSPRAERPTPPRPTDRSEEDTVTRQTLTAVEQDFHERMHAAQMYGLWELASQMTRHPEPKAVAHMWKSATAFGSG